MNEQRTDDSPEQESEASPEQQPEATSEQQPEASPEQQAEPAAEQQPGEAATPSPCRRVGRIILWCALAVLVALAVLDFRTKSAAEQTGNAWRNALRQKPIGVDLTQSELAKYIQGKPSRKTLEKPPKRSGIPAKTADVYVWKGIFRQYEITVFLGLGSDPSVELVEGPGQTRDHEKK